MLIRNSVLATLFAGFAQVIAFIACFHLLARIFGIAERRLQDTLLLSCGAGLSLLLAGAPGLYYPIHLLFLPQGHVGNVLLVLYGWAIALFMIRQARRGMPIASPRRKLV